MTDILTLARENGFSHIGFANMAALTPLEEVRKMCSADRCGKWNANWSCPPACGSIEYAKRRAFLNFARQARMLHPDCLPLTAGSCTICARCTYPNKPCRYPAKRLSSMEAFGLFVSNVCSRSGLGYNYGARTMTYTSCLLYSEE